MQFTSKKSLSPEESPWAKMKEWVKKTEAFFLNPELDSYIEVLKPSGNNQMQKAVEHFLRLRGSFVGALLGGLKQYPSWHKKTTMQTKEKRRVLMGELTTYDHGPSAH
jgi:hypothetical protein